MHLVGIITITVITIINIVNIITLVLNINIKSPSKKQTENAPNQMLI